MQMTGKYPFIKFPTEFSKMKRIIVNTQSELDRLIQLNNFRTDCFVSLYQSRKAVPNTIIDKLFYDFDAGTHEKGIVLDDLDNPECYDDIIKFHEMLMEDDIIHRIHFSGRGFQCFIYVEKIVNGTDEYKSNILRCCHKYFKSIYNIDIKVGKDLARMVRMPNTWNIEGNKWCISLNRYMLYKGYKYIRELAKKSHCGQHVFGCKLFNTDIVPQIEQVHERVQLDIKEETANTAHLLPCAQYIINQVHPSHDQKLALLGELIKHYTLGQECDKPTLIRSIENFIWKNCKWADLYSTEITRSNISCAVDTINYGYSCKSKKEMGVCVDGCNLDNIRL